MSVVGFTEHRLPMRSHGSGPDAREWVYEMLDVDSHNRVG
jgi:hypothetical protein